jgi:predicted Na+-dependent transporter
MTSSSSQTMSTLELLGSVLLFGLVFGMSATVDIQHLMTQLHNKRAIYTALGLQFVILPFLGFAVVKGLQLDHPTGITLLVITSSPGGSYSNWWCSMFNADLALSVTMTAISTVLSVVMLPLNLFVYSRIAFDEDLVDVLDWTALLMALLIVMSAIAAGLWASATFENTSDFHLMANRLGNASGILLVVFSAVMSNSNAEFRLWDRDVSFYAGVALPCTVGLILANVITTSLGLAKPERVATSIECGYQNVGIATSIAISMFNGDRLAEAIAVPFYYGVVEAVLLLIYCIGAWKAGWTRAPANDRFWHMICTSYEVLSVEDHPHQSTKGAVYEGTQPDGTIVAPTTAKAFTSPKTLSSDLPRIEEDDDYCYVQHEDCVPTATLTRSRDSYDPTTSSSPVQQVSPLHLDP